MYEWNPNRSEPHMKCIPCRPEKYLPFNVKISFFIWVYWGNNRIMYVLLAGV